MANVATTPPPPRPPGVDPLWLAMKRFSEKHYDECIALHAVAAAQQRRRRRRRLREHVAPRSARRPLQCGRRREPDPSGNC